jgi:hypothetical protein
MQRTIYIITLMLLTSFVWIQLYNAQFLEYDDNFGQLIIVFLGSVALLVVGSITIIKKTKIVRSNLVVSIVFLVINSPLTVAWVAMNYEIVFGTSLKVG